jgi:hypothetical protein
MLYLKATLDLLCQSMRYVNNSFRALVLTVRLIEGNFQSQ